MCFLCQGACVSMQRGAGRSRRCVIAQRERNNNQRRERESVFVRPTQPARSTLRGIHDARTLRPHGRHQKTPNVGGCEMRSNSWCTLFTCGVARGGEPAARHGLLGKGDWRSSHRMNKIPAKERKTQEKWSRLKLTVSRKLVGAAPANSLTSVLA